MSEDNSIKRPQFGNRFLPCDDDETVFAHNAWDNIEWSEEQKKLAEETVAKNSKIKFNQEELESIEKVQASNWDKFYGIHQNRFFKDRHWLFTEFPELAPFKTDDIPERVFPEPSKIISKIDALKIDEEVGTKIFEIGSGVGNTIFPILRYNTAANLMVYASDFSEEAIKILKENSEYDNNRCNAFVLDATAENWDVPFQANSIDLAVLIFVISAINPDKYSKIVENIYKFLKPGGLVLFRDYGRYDMAQLRFKNGKCLKDNFYLRGDGTRCYFFTQEEIRELFTSKGFLEEFNAVDRRLQVNRGKMLKMYRIWIQSKFRKPIIENDQVEQLNKSNELN